MGSHYNMTTPLVRSALEDLSRRYNVDAFLLITPGHEGPICPGGEPCIGYGDYGYGIHNTLNKSFGAYISARIQLIPLKTLKPAAQSQANIHIPLPFSQWKGSYASYSAEEKRYIQQSLYKAAEKTIQNSIDDMGLSLVKG